jgi:YbgC/YbaW family acyl-CoA thioester hydrolase
MKTIELKRQVRWMDADPSGRIYFARIFDYAGECEWNLLHDIGISRKRFGDAYNFARVHADCNFKKVMEVGASFTIRFQPEKLGRTSIRYKFEVFLEDAPDEIAAYGSITVVVLYNGKPSEIPSQIRDAFAD